MSEFNFKSNICTSREQSEKLLSLGLKKETADMRWERIGKMYDYYASAKKPYVSSDIPAWSLYRLLDILNEDDDIIDITVKDGRYGIHYGYDTEWHDNLFDALISCYENLIKEGYFNPEYLNKEK